MYSFALKPAVLYASFAYLTILSKLSLYKVSIPPRDCCSLPPSVKELVIIVPIPAVTSKVFNLLTKPDPINPPLASPAFFDSPLNKEVIDPCIPSAEGII